jgi:general secretion pathway protein J
VKAQRGFTLIEMAVALVIVAMIAVVLFEGLRFSQRAHRKVVERGADSWQIFASQRLIRSLLESAYPREAAPTEVVPVYGIDGDREKVSVLAGAPLAAGGSGLQRYEIEPRRDARGHTDVVVRWRTDPTADLRSADSTAEEILIADVAAVKWAYLDAERDTEPAWLDQWQGRASLPRLVRLQVSFASGDPRTWPELVVSPRITDDANCAFDVVAQRCRRGS